MNFPRIKKFKHFCSRIRKGEICSHPDHKLMVEEKVAKVVDDKTPNVYLSRCICKCGKRVMKNIPYAKGGTIAHRLAVKNPFTLGAKHVWGN